MAFDADDQIEEVLDDDKDLPETEEDDEEIDAKEEGEDDEEVSLEDIARELGWSPKSEWRGDPAKWTPAATFIRRTEELRRDAVKRQRESERDFQRRLQRMERANTEARARDRARLEAEYKQARVEAIKAGDVDQVEKLDAQFQQLAPQIDEDEQAEATVTTLFEKEPLVKQFWEENAWILEDEALTNRVIGFWDVTDPNRPFDHLDAIDKAERYLERFAKKTGHTQEPQPKEEKQPGFPRRDAPNFAGATRQMRSDPTSSLPPEARETGLRYVKEGLFKNLAEYAEVYNRERDKRR